MNASLKMAILAKHLPHATSAKCIHTIDIDLYHSIQHTQTLYVFFCLGIQIQTLNLANVCMAFK